MMFFGRCFVRFFSNFGYDKMIKATGRYFCDFLQSVDNIHLQMRFTYPKMKSPSMQLTEVDDSGAVLVYRSNRSGFSKYFMGQLVEIAQGLYGFDVKIRVLDSINDNPGGTTGPISLTGGGGLKTVIVKYRLDFENADYVRHRRIQWKSSSSTPFSSMSILQMKTRVHRQVHNSQIQLGAVDSSVLLQLFPFALIIDHDMKISGAGEKLVESWLVNTTNKTGKELLNAPVTDHFRLRRPKGISFCWQTVRNLNTVLFELEMFRAGCNSSKSTKAAEDGHIISVNMDRRESQGNPKMILLKGQMRYIEDIDSIVFLCSPL